MEYRPVVPAGVAGVVPGLQDYHAAIPDLSPPRSQGSSTGGASSIGDYAPRMYTPPTPPTPHEDEKVRHISKPHTFSRLFLHATTKETQFLSQPLELFTRTFSRFPQIFLPG